VLNLRGKEISVIGNVQLIVTGEMEEKALPTALVQAFPELSFNLRTDIRTRHFNGITSTKMPQHWRPEAPVSKLAYILGVRFFLVELNFNDLKAIQLKMVNFCSNIKVKAYGSISNWF
jgi:CRISPR/Cas system CMR subunit Cmr6 (Cas7 group RAMP superfamily)